MTARGGKSWSLLQDRLLAERHLIDLHRMEYACRVEGEGAPNPTLGLLEAGRELTLRCKSGVFRIRLNSPRDRTAVYANIRTRACSTLAAIDGPDRAGGYLLRIYGTGRDAAGDAPVELRCPPDVSAPEGCIGSLKVASRLGASIETRRFALQWVPLETNGDTQACLNLVHLMDAKSHTKCLGKAEISSFSIRAGDVGDLLERCGIIRYQDRGSGSVRLVEFREVKEPGQPNLSPLLDAPEGFLANWVQYELACEQRSREEGSSRTRSPIEVVARLGASTEGDCQKYRANMSSDSVDAWWPKGAFRPVEVQCVVSRDTGAETERHSATLLLLERHGSEIIASFRFERSLPRVSQFHVLPALDEMDRRQRERKLEAYHRIVSGAGVEAEMLSALLNPELVRNRSASAIRFPTMRTPTTAQIEAVLKALGDSPLVLIQGPPGTGKTDVICQIAAEFVARNRREDGSSARVLLAAQQHAAIDNLLERLSERANMEVWRIPSGTPDAISQLESQSAEVAERKRLDLRRVWTMETGGMLARIIALQDAVDELDQAIQVSIRQDTHNEPKISAAAERILQDCGIISEEIQPSKQLHTVSPIPSELRSAADVRDPLHFERLASQHDDQEIRDLAAMLVVGIGEHRRNERTWSAIDEVLSARELACASEQRLPSAPLQQGFEEIRDSAALHLDQLQSKAPIEAVKARFLQALEREPRAWSECCSQHATSIGATCQGTVKGEDEAYDLALVDEAAQVGLDVLIPLSRARKVVLVGDHKQLPPYVEAALLNGSFSPDGAAIPSLFESLWHRTPDSAREVLQTQFRMHEAIGRVVSKAFYEPDVTLRHHDADRTPRLNLFRGTPVVWIDTGSAIPTDLKVPDEVCVEYSELELELVALLLSRLRSDRLLEAGELGIACMYARQRDAMQERLRSSYFESLRLGVHCDTTDSFQGQEFEHVFVLCTRRKSGPGFLREPSRLNVAISRARRQLILFADRRLADSAQASFGRVADAMLAVGAGCRFLTITEFFNECK